MHQPFGPVQNDAAAAAGAAATAAGAAPYQDFIIRPPERNVTHGTKNRRLVIDSNARDRVLYPNAGRCDIRFNEDYQDVTSIELVQGSIPFIPYNITNFNNKFILQESTTLYDIEIPVGVYTMSTLVTALQSAINALSTVHTYTVSYDSVLTRTITISVVWGSTTGLPVFGLRFGKMECDQQGLPPQYCAGTLGRTLGYSPGAHYTMKQGTVFGTTGTVYINGVGTKFRTDYAVGDTIYIEDDFATPYTIASIVGDLLLTTTVALGSTFTDKVLSTNYVKSAGYAQLTGPDYLILEIGEARRLESSTDAVIDTFAIIPRIDAASTGRIVIHQGSLPNQREIKYFNPPVRLQKIRFTFYNPDGTVVDFYGQDFMLDFSLTLLNQSGKYNTVNSGTMNN